MEGQPMAKNWKEMDTGAAGDPVKEEKLMEAMGARLKEIGFDPTAEVGKSLSPPSSPAASGAAAQDAEDLQKYFTSNPRWSDDPAAEFKPALDALKAETAVEPAPAPTPELKPALDALAPAVEPAPAAVGSAATGSAAGSAADPD
tara:strand:+ start:1119 stop:1553 length:435 start_codon:yes stop_codon:yes gene_type:complete